VPSVLKQVVRLRLMIRLADLDGDRQIVPAWAVRCNVGDCVRGPAPPSTYPAPVGSSLVDSSCDGMHFDCSASQRVCKQVVQTRTAREAGTRPPGALPTGGEATRPEGPRSPAAAGPLASASAEHGGGAKGGKGLGTGGPGRPIDGGARAPPNAPAPRQWSRTAGARGLRAEPARTTCAAGPRADQPGRLGRGDSIDMLEIRSPVFVQSFDWQSHPLAIDSTNPHDIQRRTDSATATPSRPGPSRFRAGGGAEPTGSGLGARRPGHKQAHALGGMGRPGPWGPIREGARRAPIFEDSVSSVVRQPTAFFGSAPVGRDAPHSVGMRAGHKTHYSNSGDRRRLPASELQFQSRSRLRKNEKEEDEMIGERWKRGRCRKGAEYGNKDDQRWERRNDGRTDDHGNWAAGGGFSGWKFKGEERV